MIKKIFLKRTAAVVLSAAMAVGMVIAAPELPVEAASAANVPMFRLYNPNSGEHFYTANESERGNLESVGWKYEGIGWFAPESSNTPVYRLYNPNTGDHHFTTNSSERQSCIKAGWRDEKIGWYSDDKKSVPLYREYNPFEVVGTHNYTTSKAEHDNLVSIGWKDEGIGWYGVTPPESKYNPGDIVILGSYEQDNDLSNGAEPIEWQVLGTRDGHTLLLSKYALDTKQYHSPAYPGELSWNNKPTWEECALRSWLNNDFYNTAFSASDKQRIVTAHNANPDSYELYKIYNCGAEGGNATDDNVFLLSWTEARDYLDGKVYDSSLGTGNYNPKLLCRPTAYAEAKVLGISTYSNSDSDGEYPSDTVGCCNWWWLRSPGTSQSGAASVYATGAFDFCAVVAYQVGVRPALLID